MDPFTALGVAGSVIQIGDAALRSSRKIYQLFRDIRSSTKDVNRLKQRKFPFYSLRLDDRVIDETNYFTIGLKSVEVLVETLIRYAEDFESIEREKANRFPQVVTEAILGFKKDIDRISILLPADLSLSTSQKFKWVFAKREKDETLSILEEREKALLLVVAIMGRQDSLHTIRQLASIRTDLARLGTSDQGVCPHPTQQPVTVDEDRSQHTAPVETIGYRGFAVIPKSTELLIQNVHTLQDQLHQNSSLLQRVDRIPDKVQSQLGQLTEDIRRHTIIYSSQPTGDIKDSAADIISKLLRQEMRSMLIPVVETRLSQATAQNEEVLQACHSAIDRLNFMLAGVIHSSEQEIIRQEDRSSLDNPLELNAPPIYSSPALLARNSQYLALGHPVQISQPLLSERKFFQLSDKNWSIPIIFGRLLIRLRNYRERQKDFYAYAGPSKAYFQLEIAFIPSSPWRMNGCVNIGITDRLNYPGYHRICTTLTTFKVHNDRSTLSWVLENGTVEDLKVLFAKAQATTADFIDFGDGRSSLLEVCCTYLRNDLVRYLVSLGTNLQVGHTGNPLLAIPYLLMEYFQEISESGGGGWPEPQMRRLLRKFGRLVSILQQAGCEAPSDVITDLLTWLIKYNVFDPDIIDNDKFDKTIATTEMLLEEMEEWGFELNPNKDLGSLLSCAGIDLRTLFWPSLSNRRLALIFFSLGLDVNQPLACLAPNIASLPLFAALWVIGRDPRLQKEDIMKNENASRFIEQHPIWMMIADVIMAGADIDYAFRGVLTPTALAAYLDVFDEWCDALVYCGFNLDEVLDILDDGESKIGDLVISCTSVEVEDNSSSLDMSLGFRIGYTLKNT